MQKGRARASVASPCLAQPQPSLSESAICIMQGSHGICSVQNMTFNLPCIDSALLVSLSSILVPSGLSVISFPWLCSVHHHHSRGPARRKSRSGARLTLVSRRTCPRQSSNRPLRRFPFTMEQASHVHSRVLARRPTDSSPIPHARHFHAQSASSPFPCRVTKKAWCWRFMMRVGALTWGGTYSYVG